VICGRDALADGARQVQLDQQRRGSLRACRRNVTNRRVAGRLGALRIEPIDEPHREQRRNGTGKRESMSMGSLRPDYKLNVGVFRCRGRATRRRLALTHLDMQLMLYRWCRRKPTPGAPMRVGSL